MICSRTNSILPPGPDAHDGDEVGACWQGNWRRRVAQRNLQEQPTAIRERSDDSNVDPHEREARRATNNAGTGIALLELFEPQQLAQPTPEGLWGRTGLGGGWTGSSGGNGPTGGRSGLFGGSEGLSGGSTGLGSVECSVPRSRCWSGFLACCKSFFGMTMSAFLPRSRCWGGSMPGDDEPARIDSDHWPVRHIGGYAEGTQAFEVQFRRSEGAAPGLRSREGPRISIRLGVHH